MKHRKNNVNINCTVSGAPGEAFSLKRGHGRATLVWLRRNDDCLAIAQHCGRGGRFRIARAQLTLMLERLASEQSFGISRCDPSAFFRDADRHDFILRRINGLEHRSRREKRNFVFSAAATEKNSHSNLLHSFQCGRGFGFSSITGKIPAAIH